MRWSRCLLGLAAGLATAAFCHAEQGTAALQPCADAQGLAEALARINALRHAGGAPCTEVAQAPALAWEPHLAAGAWAQARDLALRDAVDHVDAQQQPLRSRLIAAGYAMKASAENVAAGQPDFDAALAGWLASRDHCENLMQPRYVDAGLACAERRGTRYERFWVLLLGLPARR